MPIWEKFGKSSHTGHSFLYFFSSLTKAKKLDITNFSADNYLGQGVKPYLGNKILTNTCESFNFHLFGSVLSFLNGPSSANHYNYFNQYMWKMLCPSSVRHQASNPQPLEHESSPIITRPVLPPIGKSIVISMRWYIHCIFNRFLSPPSHWQKSFAVFGLGYSTLLLVANWKKYPSKFHRQRGFLAFSTVVRLGLIWVN